ncbi:class I SAM-dependent methyltransferase [Hansschlegelia quercus]|uniref:Class I SAM-dependent methyltransferase n=1 Tax=Hansschlegelia quercus TaxID=2528245 RepID=A0A4Q9GCL9_9HYPH|nr:class I SAM-dependent methyltransferase [Hansschlegelia quercus]TBN47268.1 class I SAM-dependent methyltransferase [Hansschlegelia quercus]
MKDEFSELYLRGGWKRGGGETASGAGSTLAYTQQIRAELPKLFEKLGIKTILDAPCGDFNWFAHVKLDGVNYIGMDIVSEMVAENQRRYGSSEKRFVQGDASSTPLPKVDLMFCRDLMRHIKFEASLNVLRNFLRSGIPYLLATSYVVRRNREIEGNFGSRPINLRLDPFYLPEPQERIYDSIEGFKERYLCLWTRVDVERALQTGAVAVDERAASGERTLDDLKIEIEALRSKRVADLNGNRDETSVILDTVSALVKAIEGELKA